MTASYQVVVGDIPQRRTGFLPRPALLARLKGAGQRTPVIYVLTGTPGVGKTELAAAYARARIAAGWRLVAWINARNGETLRAGLADVAEVQLARDVDRRYPADSSQAIRRWLETDGEGCLLVFDDAEDPDVLRPFVPVSGAAQVLITAARESMADLGTGIPVEVFSAEEAVALLDGRTGLADAAGAEAVAAEVGYLPLALDQAAAVIAGQHLEYRAYLERLRTMPGREQLLQAEEPPYPHGAAEAVQLSLAALRGADQAEVTAGTLEMIAVLSGASVGRGLLRMAGENGALASSGRPVAAGQVDQALEQLAEQALLAVPMGGQTVLVHRFVAQVVLADRAQQGQLAAVCRATASALEAYARTRPRPLDHAAISEILAHVTALLENASRSEDGADQELTTILLRLRFLALYYLLELGDSTPEAISIGEQLTADLEWTLGPDHPDTLNAMNSLATAYQAAGLTAEAIPLFEQALVGRVRLLGHDHPDTLTTQSSLATTYQVTGRAVEAILMFKLTLAAKERLLGIDHPSTLASRGNLAAAYRDVGRIAEAIPLFEQTLAGREQLLGSGHPDTQRSRESLAAAYKAAGRAAEAVPLVEQILTTREWSFGMDHPRTLSSRNNLAEAYRESGRAAEAIPLFEQTLATCERLLGADDPRTRATRHNLALARADADRAG